MSRPGDAARRAPTELAELLEEYDRALAHTDRLWTDLPESEVRWRPDERSSAIAWHVGHQPAVAHFLIRNLTAAEPRLDHELDALFDSATPEPDRGALPDLDRLRRYRAEVIARVRFRVGEIDAGRSGAPDQLRAIAATVLTAIVNHEYQHDQWIAEVRRDQLDRSLPEPPVSARLRTVDGYLVLT